MRPTPSISALIHIARLQGNPSWPPLVFVLRLPWERLFRAQNQQIDRRHWYPAHALDLHNTRMALPETMNQNADGHFSRLLSRTFSLKIDTGHGELPLNFLELDITQSILSPGSSRTGRANTWSHSTQ